MTEQDKTQPEVVRARRQNVMFHGMGGTGANILRKYRNEKSIKATAAFRAVESFAFFDTSAANLYGVDVADVFMVEGVNGGGSDRSRNAQKIIDSINPYINKHGTGDINVVVYGVSGATGSVAGPALVEALMKQGKSVVSIIVAGVETVKACDNAYRTFMGLEMAAKNLGKPVVFTYTATDSRKGSEIDDLYQLKCMAAISTLACGRNLRLDAADVENFFNFTSVTSRQASLALLEIFQLETEAQLIPETPFISSATLLRDESVIHPSVTSEYGTLGYYPAPENVETDGYFFGISTDSLNRKVIANLAELKKQADSQTSVVNRVQSLFGDEPDSASSIVGSNIFL